MQEDSGITVYELYKQFSSNDLTKMCNIVELLVLEKKVMGWNDDSNRLYFYIQPRFQESMDKHLETYLLKKEKGAV